MNFKQAFSLRHRPAYDYYLQFFYESLSEAQLRNQPSEMANSIAWCLLHIARAEDIGINRLASDGTQVFDEDDWPNRLNVPFRHFGIGMSSNEVAKLSHTINIPALREYHQLVAQCTARVLENYPVVHFDQVVDDERLHKVLVEEGAVRCREVANVFNSYRDMTRGWILMHLGLTHTFQHIGEAMTIASLLGVQRT